MSNKLLIGLDFGTDSVRALLTDSEGTTVAESVCSYPRWSAGKYCDPARNQFRQHPLDYIEGMETVVRAVLKECDPRRVRGIGVDTTGSTPCALGRDGKPLALDPRFSENPDAMFLLWKDHTALEEATRINEIAKNGKGPDYTAYEGGTYSCEWFWSKILHVLKKDRAIRENACRFQEHCDWIPALLTGVVNRAGRCAAGHKAMWHESWGGLPPEEFFVSVDPLLRGMRSRLYRETYTADLPVGTLTQEWAERFGLSAAVVVAGGAIDCHAGAVGAGIEVNQMVKVMGTSTCDILVVPQGSRCIRGICGQVNGSVLPGLIGMEAGQAAFGDIYSWFRRLLSYGGNNVTLEQLEHDAAVLDDSALTALDWMNGRRTPDANPLLKGAILGITLGTTAPMIYRALVESTAFGSRAILERFIGEGLEIQEIKAIGGIARKSPFVMQFCADVLGRKISVVRSEQTCALGSAMYAAAASGVYPGLATAITAMNSGFDAVYTPRKNYDERYRHYRRWAAAAEEVCLTHPVNCGKE